MAATRRRDIRFKTGFRNTVYDAMLARPGWRETESEVDWDVIWADVHWIRDCFDHLRLEDHQKLNHFRNHFELTRKDNLVKNIKRMKKQLERADALDEAAKYSFLPTSFVLPAEYGLFVEAFKREAGGVWIMKPIGKAQGKGIFLFTKLSDIKDWKKDHTWKSDAPQAESYVVQKYIENPYTIGGKKFDMRVYALVTSYAPLTVWLYRTGFGRFSNTRYTIDRENVDNLYMHLTNVAIQKTAENYQRKKGCKLSLQKIKMLMASKHGLPTIDRLFADMQNVILRSLLAVSKIMIQDKHCFEMYGYDLIFDTDLKVWLLEVNASPSLTADTDADYEMKRMLLDDMFNVVDVEGKLTGTEVQVGGFDLIWQGGPIRVDRPPTCSTYLGCVNNRKKQLKVVGGGSGGATGSTPVAAPTMTKRRELK